MRFSLMVLIATAALPFAASSSRVMIPTMPQQRPCENGMRTSVSLGTNFNGQARSLEEARSAIDMQRSGLESAAKKAGVALELTNYTYNINANQQHANSGNGFAIYNYSGNLNFQLEDESVAKKLTEELDKQKRQFNMSLNASRCSN